MPTMTLYFYKDADDTISSKILFYLYLKMIKHRWKYARIIHVLKIYGNLNKRFINTHILENINASYMKKEKISNGSFAI